MSEPTDRVDFEIVESHGANAIVPVINGTRLTDLVHEFERRCGWTPEDAYGGLIPSFYRFGPLADHYRGKGTSHGFDTGTPVLGCACGEWGCWPLLVDARHESTSVIWSRFVQPYRPDRSYDGLGPFRFDGLQFDQAVLALQAIDPAEHPNAAGTADR